MLIFFLINVPTRSTLGIPKGIQWVDSRGLRGITCRCVENVCPRRRKDVIMGAIRSHSFDTALQWSTSTLHAPPCTSASDSDFADVSLVSGVFLRSRTGTATNARPACCKLPLWCGDTPLSKNEGPRLLRMSTGQEDAWEGCGGTWSPLRGTYAKLFHTNGAASSGWRLAPGAWLGARCRSRKRRENEERGEAGVRAPLSTVRTHTQQEQ